MMTVQIAEQTPLGKWIREAGVEAGAKAGREAGLEAGLAQGRLLGQIESAERLLRRRYPALAAEFSRAGLDSAAVERLIDALCDAVDEAAARRVIESAKPGPPSDGVSANGG